MNLKHGGEGLISAAFLRQRTRGNDLLERDLVFTLLAMRSAFPEMCERDQMVSGRARFCPQNEFAPLDRGVDLIGR